MDIYEVQINEKIPKVVNGTIIFTYEDTFGEEVTLKKDFEIENKNFIEATALADGNMNNVDNNNKDLFTVKNLFGLIILSGLVFIGIKKVKKIKMSRKA